MFNAQDDIRGLPIPRRVSRILSLAARTACALSRSSSAFGAAAIVSGLLTCNVVTFFVAIAAK